MASALQKERQATTNELGWTRIFKRHTNSLNWMPEVDGLRFIAIFGVVVTHVHGYLLSNVENLENIPTGVLQTALDTAGRGVEMFFVISGFILALPFGRRFLQEGKEIRLGSYYWRRVTRLEPPYILIMVALFFLRAFPIFPQLRSEFGTETLLQSLIASLFYCHYFVFEHAPYLNGVAWSLEVEVQYYLLAPLVAWCFFKMSKVVRYCSLISLILSAPWLQEFSGLTRYTILGEYQFFLMGLLLVDLHLHKVRINLPTIPNFLFASCLFIALFAIPIRAVGPLNLAIFSALVLLFDILALSEGWLKKTLSVRYFALIGGMCYSIYLIHYQLLLVLGKLVGKLAIGNDFWINFLVYLVIIGTATLIVSSIYFILIEKPCMDPKWISKLFARLSTKFHSVETKPS